MSSPHQARRAEEKLALILDRIGSIRMRLNSLAWQRGAFGTLGWTIAIGAIVVLAAFYLTPLTFLIVAATLAMVAVAGIANSLRAAWRAHVNRGAAASIADRRADLKGRLETIVEIVQHRKVIKLTDPYEQPMLWSYLIEDTLSRQEEFQPRRVEARRVSRSIYGLLGSLALAAAIFPLIARLHGKPFPVSANQDEMTIDLNDLHLRAGDSDSDDGTEVHADAATMRRLEEKMAAEGVTSSGKSSDTPMDKMVNHAKDLAGHLQDKLTGRTSPRPRITLKLADNADDMNSLDRRNQLNLNAHRKNENPDAHFEHEKNSNGDDISKPGNQPRPPDQIAQAPGGSSPEDTNGGRHADGSDQTADKSAQDSDAEQGNSGSSSHGVGTDPDTLFGPTSDPKLGGQGFEISIDARSETKGPKASGHAYLPPKVRTPLNASQHPDEPIARASVPDEDRAAIKRVFER
jgi:hypothetical protein